MAAAANSSSPAQPPTEDTSASHSERFHAALSSLQTSIAAASTEAELSEARAALDGVRAIASEGAQWWVGYDMRRAHELVREAEDAVDSAARRLKPRARFRFRDRAEARAGRTSASTARAAETKQVARAPGRRDARLRGDEDEQSGIRICGEQVERVGGKLVVHDVGGCDVTIRDVHDATVVLLGIAGAVRVINASNSEIVAGAIQSSAHVTCATECTFRLACRQVRVHKSRDCLFWLYVTGKPVIEQCRGIRFGKGRVRREDEEAVEGAGLVGKNRWHEVSDFNWLHEERSPNWKAMEGEELAWISKEGDVAVERE